MKKTVNYLAILSCSVLGITLAHADGYNGHHLKPYPTYSATSPSSAKSSASTSSATSYKTSFSAPVSSEYYKTGPIVNVPDSDASKGAAVVAPSDYYKTYRL